MFDKILIANRGEIAVRVIRACREMGVKTVAIYSEADAQSLHVRFADEAYCIGPPESAKSYLNVPRIIAAAEVTDAEAVHPGYGFLAENPYFAEACEASNLAFIGPAYETITDVGDKAAARRIIAKAGVPLVPGSDGPVKTEDDALDVADEVGYPVMVKAVAGGGGRGMRIAHTPAALAKAFATAAVEAEAAFGNPELYVEKLVPRARHVEVQILGDGRGQVIHLGERDCSIQRRHQKLVEESPAPALPPKTREKMFAAAVAAGRAVNYRSAGTVEFLVEEEGSFYFIEVNARVQVEHPVSEMVTGVDIIKEQFRVAAGGALLKNPPRLEGHAIECRINAEDTSHDFRPAPGTIENYIPPGGPGVRVDTHIYPGYAVPPHYDSLLAKLIVWAPNRDEAVARMARALAETTIEGVPTTVPFHYRVVQSRLFKDAKISTGFIAELEASDIKERG
ncbi:MAG: acetyl-CoA carboxylase biotin carboxylase subunit [candidate division Zixibacteria bacterium]|nr:acetyl-CoA carboxylase biotin carboxylase subunit [candidate division Zixibacteria bacterium]